MVELGNETYSASDGDLSSKVCSFFNVQSAASLGAFDQVIPAKGPLPLAMVIETPTTFHQVTHTRKRQQNRQRPLLTSIEGSLALHTAHVGTSNDILQVTHVRSGREQGSIPVSVQEGCQGIFIAEQLKISFTNLL